MVWRAVCGCAAPEARFRCRSVRAFCTLVQRRVCTLPFLFGGRAGLLPPSLARRTAVCVAGGTLGLGGCRRGGAWSRKGDSPLRCWGLWTTAAAWLPRRGRLQPRKGARGSPSVRAFRPGRPAACDGRRHTKPFRCLRVAAGVATGCVSGSVARSSGADPCAGCAPPPPGPPSAPTGADCVVGCHPASL